MDQTSLRPKKRLPAPMMTIFGEDIRGLGKLHPLTDLPTCGILLLKQFSALMMRGQNTNPGPPYQRLVFRASGSRRPDAGLPLTVRSVGHYRVSPGWTEETPPKWFLELFWTVAGRGTFHLGTQKYSVRPGDIFVYEAGERHSLAAGPQGWEYRFFTLDSPGASMVRGLFELPRHHPAGPCPEASFDALEKILASPTVPSPREASVRAYAIFEAASRTVPVGDPLKQGVAITVKAGLDRRFRDPNFGVETLASELKLHRTTLRRAFLKAYGVSPGQYLSSVRLQNALSLLRTSDQTVAEISRISGFRSAEYLARVVKTETGLSPSVFRKP
jgi:AraC-like DNA-binding protein